MAEIKGLTIAIGADMKTFNKELRKADREIRSTSKEVDSLAKSLELDFDSGRFEHAMKRSQDVISLTENKVSALREQLKHIEKHKGADSEDYKKLQSELLKAEGAAVLFKKKLEELKSLKIDELANKFKNVGDGISNVGQKLMPVSIAASGILASFSAIGLSVAKTGGELDDLAMQLDMTAEQYQKLSYVAAQTGADIGRVERAFVLLRDTSGKALLGETNKSTMALQQLGFTLDEIRLSAPDDLFYKVVQSLASMEDQTLQSAYATEIFNQRVAHDILPLLRSGANAVEELTAEFEELGYLTNDQVSRLATFDDSLLRIRTALGAIKDQIGAALLPIMEEMAQVMETKIVPAIRKVSEWFINLDDSQKKTILTITAVVAALGPALIVIGKLTTGIGGLIKGVRSLSGALSFLAAHPIVAVIAVIVGLLIALYTKNEQFRESVNGLISQLSNALLPLFNTFMKSLKSIFDALMPIINILGNVFGKIIEKLTPIISFLVELLVKYLVPAIELIAEKFANVFNTIQKVMGKWVKGVEKVINGVIDLINYLIRQLNKVGDVLGFNIKEIDQIDLSGKITKEIKSEPIESALSRPENVLSNNSIPLIPSSVVNNDYSNKDITIEVIVQNYAEEVDIDKLVRDINLKLAEQL